jgi:transposase
MPRTRPPYPPEFRAEAAKLARSSEKPLSETARDLGVSAERYCQMLWIGP